MNSPSDVVVYDLDDTLVNGDMGAAFVRHLLLGWRGVLGLPLVPLGLALMLTLATRRFGVALFLRMASLGRSMAEMDALATRFAEARTLSLRDRERRWLENDLAAGQRVVIATGAFEVLAGVALRRMGLDGRVALVASRLQPGLMSVGVADYCHHEAKLQSLAAAGFSPPFAKAVSDSFADAPLLRESRLAIMVNASPRSRRLLQQAIGQRLIDADLDQNFDASDARRPPATH